MVGFYHSELINYLLIATVELILLEVELDRVQTLASEHQS